MVSPDCPIVFTSAAGGGRKTVWASIAAVLPQLEPAPHPFHAPHKGRRKSPIHLIPGNPAKGDPHGKLRSTALHHHRQQRRRAR